MTVELQSCVALVLFDVLCNSTTISASSGRSLSTYINLLATLDGTSCLHQTHPPSLPSGPLSHLSCFERQILLDNMYLDACRPLRMVNQQCSCHTVRSECLQAIDNCLP